MNGKNVSLTDEEIKCFISQLMTANPYWKYSKIVDYNCVLHYLRDKATILELKEILKYVVIYSENIGLSSYLINQTDLESKNRTLLRISSIRKLYTEAMTNESLLKENLEKINDINLKDCIDPF